jgi:hypothetical protein
MQVTKNVKGYGKALKTIPEAFSRVLGRFLFGLLWFTLFERKIHEKNY